MSLGNMFLALFLALLSLQLGLSMELPIVAFIGGGLSLFGGFRIVAVERPTWGLLFVLFATGGFVGNQVLEEWAVEGSWAQSNGLGAGIVLSFLVYLLWRKKICLARLSIELKTWRQVCSGHHSEHPTCSIKNR